MVRIQRILCPVDFYPASERAVNYAVKLAKNYESQLILLHVVAPILPDTYEVPIDLKNVVKALTEESTQRLQRLSKRAKAAKLPVECFVRTGDIHQEIKKVVSSAKVDFVVMGTHGRRGIERWVLGSVAEQLLRSIKAPLMTIGKTKKPETAPPVIRRILVTTDFSEGTSEAIDYAFSIAQECQAQISLLHVIGDIGANTSGAYREILITELGDQLAKLIPDEARVWCDVKTLVETGLPFQVILRTLEKENIDLLVMNVHRKRHLNHSLLDSTAERVVRSAPCPVLMIPHRPPAQPGRRPATKAA
jgi:nucleotide-binding universal stress UspA family protein